MRINRETLLNIANDTVAQRTRRERGLLSAYLCGSLLGDDYLLGGTADIDLVFIHMDAFPASREIVRLTDDVHLDIAHYFEKDFRETRKLRLHAWIGPALSSCRLLYDPQHFLDFTRASVGGQFDRPDNVLGRAQPQLAHARQIWSGLAEGPPARTETEQVAAYLRAVEHAANAVASLSGGPLTERRFLLSFPERAVAVGRPGLHAGLLGILGAPKVAPESLHAWLGDWLTGFDSLPADQAPARLQPFRRSYYHKAFLAMVEGDQPQAVLWPLLRTWTLVAGHLTAGQPAMLAWENACRQLELLGAGFEGRLNALDAFLDMVEETLEAWGRENGV